MVESQGYLEGDCLLQKSTTFLQILENHIPISIVRHPRVRKEQHTACPQPPKVTARKAVALLLLSALVCGAEHE